MLERCLLLTLALTSATTVGAQIPDEFKNLQVFPEDIPRDDLIDVMRHFSFALDVRCQHCHVGGDGTSLTGVAFHEDGPTKEKARSMVRMTRQINNELLTEIQNRELPGFQIQCKTCHRGQSKPLLLTQEMRIAIDASGVQAGIDRYRMLRETSERAGAFDFREWEVNTLAEDLANEGRNRDAIAIYELNQEYFPQSVSIAMALGSLYEEVDDTEAAIRNYETVLELSPGHEGAKERLDALR